MSTFTAIAALLLVACSLRAQLGLDPYVHEDLSGDRALRPQEQILPHDASSDEPVAEISERKISIGSTEFAIMSNIAYFEAGWTDKGEECFHIAGTIIGRLAQAKPGYGRNIWAIVNPTQFHVVSDFSLCATKECDEVASLRDGFPLLNYSHYKVNKRGKVYAVSDKVAASYRECRAAIEDFLQDPPPMVYLNFRAAGNGRNTFYNEASLPEVIELRTASRIDSIEAAIIADEALHTAPPPLLIEEDKEDKEKRE